MIWLGAVWLGLAIGTAHCHTKMDDFQEYFAEELEEPGTTATLIFFLLLFSLVVWPWLLYEDAAIRRTKK